MHRPSLTARRAAALVALPLAAAAIAAPAADAAPARSDLYVATTTQGKVTPLAHGAYRIKFSDPAKSISAFTDRPERHTSTQSLRSFVSGWKNNGFAADHPNAALVVDGATAGHDTYTYEISKPRITRSGALVLRAKRLGARAPRHFGRASLFIDDSGVQTPITISATVGPGQSALLEFDDPIDIEPTGAFTPEFTATNGAFAELTDKGLVMSNGHSGQSSNVALAIDVDHVGTGPITGTANLLGAATASIVVPGHAPVTIANGPFSVPVS
jgi:hypothetical protein